MKLIISIFVIIIIISSSIVTAQPLCSGHNCPCLRDFTGECIDATSTCFPFFPIERDNSGAISKCSPFSAFNAEACESNYVGAYQTLQIWERRIQQLERRLEQCKKSKGRRC